MSGAVCIPRGSDGRRYEAVLRLSEAADGQRELQKPIQLSTACFCQRSIAKEVPSSQGSMVRSLQGQAKRIELATDAEANMDRV